MVPSEVLESYKALRRALALLKSRVTKNLDLSDNQFSFLFRLYESSASMGQLAEFAVTDKASTTRTVALMEKAGLVRRVADEQDKRIVRIELTGAGKTMARKTQDIRDEVASRLESALNKAERKQFTQLVAKIVDHLEKH